MKAALGVAWIPDQSHSSAPSTTLDTVLVSWISRVTDCESTWTSREAWTKRDSS